MIQKLKKQNTWGECLEKLNEVIDAVNELQEQVKKTDQNLNFEQPEVKENHKIRSTNERLRKALDIAVDALKEISLHYQNKLDKDKPIQWFPVATKMCDYADDAIKAITALEQKDVK